MPESSGMKNRSPRFPFIPLEEAVDILRKLAAFQSDPEKPLRRPEMLKALDYASFHGAAVKTIGALRAYDLLVKQDDGVVISDTGHKILAAKSHDDRREHLQRAALSPLMFRMLWRRARHCTQAELATLLQERDFTEQGAVRASKIYRKNDEFAALHSIEVEPDLPERGRRKAGPDPAKKRANRAAKKRAQQAKRDRPLINPNSLSMPLSTGRAVVPTGITEDEFNTLMQTLRAWKGQLVKSA